MNQPPISEKPWQADRWTEGWSNWFMQAFRALAGWKATFNKTLVFDFASIAAQSQLSTTVTVKGVRQGDGVSVTPFADTAGIHYSGVVTANDTVTIYAKNFTAGAIDPASTTFRVIVFQY